MAKRPRSLASFEDVKLLLQKASELGTLDVSVDVVPAASVLVARMNKFRAIYREREEAAGREPASPFDHLIIRHLRNAEGNKTTTLRIETRIATYEVTGPNGEKLSFSDIASAPEVETPEERTRREKEDAEFLARFNTTGALGLHTED